MKKESIALIGFRCTGKSTVGRILAEKPGRTFVDMDAALTASFGRDIGEWVESNGWEAFREAEADLLSSLGSRTGLVLATGGGVVIRAPNRAVLKAGYFVVWLRASADTVCRRLTGDPVTASQRPALTAMPQREEVEHLLAERSPLYEQAADFTLETDRLSPRDLAAMIEHRLRAGAEAP